MLDWEDMQMADRVFLYRCGNGNDGTFPRGLFVLRANDNPDAALRALILDRYIPRTLTRRYVNANLVFDFGHDDSASASVYEDLEGVPAYGGGAWLCASLIEQTGDDLAYYSGVFGAPKPIRASLDSGALRVFRQHNRS